MTKSASQPPIRRLPQVLAVAFALAAGALLYGQLDRRLSEVGGEIEERDARQRALVAELQDVRKDLLEVRAGLERAAGDAQRTAELESLLRTTENRLGAIGSVVEAQASSLATLEEERASFGPDTLVAVLDERDERLKRRWREMDALVSSARELASESRREMDELRSATERDLARMWRELVGPVVQLAGDTSVGSGVLLEPSFDPETQTWQAHLLTAWHVVRDIQGDLSNLDMPVPVTIYSEDGDVREETAKLLCHNADIDAALLLVRSVEPIANGAALADRDSLQETKIFKEVYAVGCPLGNDPIPTRGEISTCDHRIEGQSYWMINAPTYIGNSGGGIFDSETHELLAIFSKIYTHGSLRPTIVPHMGLATPLGPIYDWLEGEGFAYVYDEAGESRIAGPVDADHIPASVGSADVR